MVASGGGERCRAPSSAATEVLDIGAGLDAAACADGGTVQRGSGTRKIKLALQRPALRQTVNKASVKNIAGAGSVHCLDAICGGVVKLRAVPGEHAFFAPGGGRGDASIAIPGGGGRRGR